MEPLGALSQAWVTAQAALPHGWSITGLWRFGEDGLAHEHRGVMDALAMMQQLGAVPKGPPA